MYIRKKSAHRASCPACGPYLFFSLREVIYIVSE